MQVESFRRFLIVVTSAECKLFPVAKNMGKIGFFGPKYLVAQPHILINIEYPFVEDG